MPTWLAIILLLITGAVVGYLIRWVAEPAQPAEPDGLLDKRVACWFLFLSNAVGLKPERRLGETQLASLMRHCDAIQRGDAALPDAPWKLRAEALFDYFVAGTPPWKKDSRGDLMDRYIERVRKGIKSHHRVQLGRLSSALECYTGKAPDTVQVNDVRVPVYTSRDARYTNLLQRHAAIQEQANQCGYSTILYSLSASSSIFTPNFVNGWAHSDAMLEYCKPDATLLSECRENAAKPSTGSTRSTSATAPTLCPSCLRSIATLSLQNLAELSQKALRTQPTS